MIPIPIPAGRPVRNLSMLLLSLKPNSCVDPSIIVGVVISVAAMINVVVYFMGVRYAMMK